MKILTYLLCVAGLGLALSGCTDPAAVVDTTLPLADHNWSYINRAKFDVKIDEPGATYNIYLNLRVTGDYKYSNIFLLIYQTAPGEKAKVTRYELTLANRAGEWLGKGTGNLYAYQVPFRTRYKFPDKGVYHFEIEQNMRDNPLHEVSDVGLRVEKAQ